MTPEEIIRQFLLILFRFLGASQIACVHAGLAMKFLFSGKNSRKVSCAGIHVNRLRRNRAKASCIEGALRICGDTANRFLLELLADQANLSEDLLKTRIGMQIPKLGIDLQVNQVFVAGVVRSL